MQHTSDAVRKMFLDYFAARGHQVVPSGPVIAPNDPTLMFANAGMVQFKEVFTGKEQRSYQRAASAQKCIRLSGKHNDLENVGPSPRHHTFFEMLGNFSFGDYFKQAAIEYAWTFVTQELGLARERLVVTYFGGEQGIAADDQAREIWEEVSGLGSDRIIACPMSENFWQMGDVGPCGPCSEIHYYLGPDPDPASFGQEQTPEGYGWMEIWNLVFMQFDRDKEGNLTPLPRPCIDTGMGLERIVAVLQGKTSTYETDVLRALVDKAAQLAKKPYRGSMSPDDVSMRVIADHSRLAAFLLAEGVMPDTNGREYVLRRVMRRAIRHGHRLGIQQPFLHEVTLEVGQLMGKQYPELLEKAEHIASVTEQEEIRFRRTIERGLQLLDERFGQLQQQGQRVLDGGDAFRLYDTYGFPLDLTQVICQERGFTVDDRGYEAALEEARRRSEFKGVEQAIEAVYREALAAVEGQSVQFTGYDNDSDRSELVAIIHDGKLVSELKAPAGGAVRAELVFAKTPFYGESGGQVGDTGVISSEGAQFGVEDTQRPISGLVVHRGALTQGSLKLGQVMTLTIDAARRRAIRRNHSATHLLHWALRQVLGPHAQQKGSVVAADRLRFDFTHGQPLTPQQIRQIEDLANERILSNAPVRTELLGLEEARKRGAVMLFGEKYGETVRVLSMSESVELCGGTHVRATGDIGLLKIVSEQGIAAGVRRVTAITGAAALDHIRELEATLARASEVVKAGNLDLPTRLEKLMASERALQKQVAELQKRLASGGAQSNLEERLRQAREIAGVRVLGLRTEVSDRAALRELAEQLRDKLGRSVVLVASEHDGKVQMVLTVSKELTGRLKAGELIRPIAAVVGGSGGGRPDMAQAGGTETAKLSEAIEQLYQVVQPRLDAPAASA